MVPSVLGLNRTQDASACLIRGQSAVRAIRKEQLARHKHHWGRVGDVADIYRPYLPGPYAPLDVLVECWSSDAEISRLADDERELAGALALAPDTQRACISHHLSHLYGAFHPSPFDAGAVLVIDDQGCAVAGPWQELPRPECHPAGAGIQTACMPVFTRRGTVFNAGSKGRGHLPGDGR